MKVYNNQSYISLNEWKYIPKKNDRKILKKKDDKTSREIEKASKRHPAQIFSDFKGDVKEIVIMKNLI